MKKRVFYPILVIFLLQITASSAFCLRLPSMFSSSQDPYRLRENILNAMLDPVIEAVDNLYEIADKHPTNVNNLRYDDALLMEKEMKKIKPLMIEFIEALSKETEFDRVSKKSIKDIETKIGEFKRILKSAEQARANYYDTDHLDILGTRNGLRSSLHLVSMRLHGLKRMMQRKDPEVVIRAAGNTFDPVSDILTIAHQVKTFQ